MRATTRLPYLIKISLFITIFCTLFNSCVKATSAKIKKDAQAYYYFILAELTNNFKLKEELLLKTLKLDPNNRYIEKELALTYIHNNQIEKAKKILEKLVKKYPSNIEIKLLLAKLYLFQGNSKKAKQILEKIKIKSPKNEELLRLLISLYLEEGNWNKALTYLNQAIKKFPNNYILWLFKARVLANKKDYKKAEKSYVTALKLSGFKKSVFFEVVKFLDDIGDFKEMEKVIKLAIRKDPSNKGLVKFLLSVYIENQDWQKCTEFLGNYTKIYPTPEFKFFLGFCLENQNKLKEALRIFKSIPQNSKWFVQAANEVLNILQKEDVKKARDFYLKLLKLKNDEENWVVMLTQSAEDLDMCSYGVKVGEKGLKLYPNSLKLALALASDYACLNRYDLVIKVLKPFLKKHPKNPYLLNFVGYSYVEVGKDLKYAEKLLKAAIKLKPKDPYILDSLGWLYFKLGNYKKAKYYLEKAVKLLKEPEPVILEHYGKILWEFGDKKRACSFYEKALNTTIHKIIKKEIKKDLELCQ